MYKRYSGEFLSTKNVRWRADIYQEADAAFPTVGELRFPSENPLVIEWEHTDKEEAICGSTATLRIVSPGDRTYEDLYIITPGTVRMDVYRNGGFYWSGTLDPEFYEEPYAYPNEYEVNLTFSDFGILDRFKYTLAGTRTLQELVEHALDKSGINCKKLDQRHITTSSGNGSPAMTLADLSLHSENFYDEDGDSSTLYEMLEGILQPLGLRMQQKNGIVWIYDLNGLYTLGALEPVEWTDENQTMGTDKVVNNAKITFSPYAQAEIMKDSLSYGDEYSEDLTNLTSSAPGGTQEYYTYYPDYNGNWEDYQNLSFTIFLSDKASGLAEKSSAARYFHIQPLLGGTEGEGIAYGFYTGGHGNLAGGRPERKLGDPAAKTRTVLMRTFRIPVQALEEADRKNYYLRLGMDMMLDMRYNPFTDANDDNESGNYGLADYRFNYVQVPATVTLYGEDGTALLHYRNDHINGRRDLKGSLSSLTLGEWQPGEAPYQSCWLEWYNPEDRHFSSGVSGWKTNRHNIGLSLQDCYTSFKKLDAGQYMPYPPLGGYLEVCIHTGVWIYEWSDKVSGRIKVAPAEWYNKIRWLLYKAPLVEMVKRNITHSSADSEDIEYNGTLNESAKDNLELDTVCGTSANVIPSAKGVYMRTDDGTMLKVLTRGGRTTQAEQLLIGTLYSQFAERRTKLTGTAGILSGGLCTYTEVNQPGKRFICLSDVQDTINDESDAELVELRPDEYTAKNE